jgi:hypothetical protein
MKLAIALLLSGAALDAQPASGDNGPNLDFTMKYIQDVLNTVNSQWRQSPNEGDRDQLTPASFRITGAKADAKECALSFRSATVSFFAGDAPGSDQFYLQLRNVSKLTVETFEARDERLGNSRRFAPSGFVLLVKMVPGKPAVRVHSATVATPAAPTPRIRFEEVAQVRAPAPASPVQRAQTASEATEIPLLILDDELTQRLAKAIVHAVELCGGGDKDPFK